MSIEQAASSPHFEGVENKITPEFLSQQISLSKNEWSDSFHRYVESKIAERKQLEEEDTPKPKEILREETFNRYLKGLGLSEDDIRGKKILDLGCGEAEFIDSCISKGLTQEAYGMDLEVRDDLENTHQGRIIRGSYENTLPIHGIDYIVSVGSVSNAVWGGETSMDIKKIIDNAVSSLKEKGEFRIYPIQQAAVATQLPVLEKSFKKWQELLDEASSLNQMEWHLEPRDIKVLGNDNDIILESVLVITKKNN